jgi:hypothetical protein
MFEPTIVRGALVDCLRKLDPRVMVRNPVMFVVEIGSVLTTILLFRDLGSNTTNENVFTILVTLWLWFTVLFANFAEAMAEGRGKAQAATLRKTRAETVAHVQLPDGSVVDRPSPQLQIGDLCVVVAGEVIPGDGDVVEGIATVETCLAIQDAMKEYIRAKGFLHVLLLHGYETRRLGRSFAHPDPPKEEPNEHKPHEARNAACTRTVAGRVRSASITATLRHVPERVPEVARAPSSPVL